MTGRVCACSCGGTAFELRGAPLFRIVCHCTLCQRFNQAPFSDILVYDAGRVAEPADGAVQYSTYKPPPNVQRGKCAACGDPAIEKFAAPLLPKLTMVPAAAHRHGTALPPPVAHIFYETRVADVDDELPKHLGFVASQLAFLRHLLVARLSRRRR